MIDFGDETKAILHNNTIDSYETDEQAYIELQRFFRHWFDVLVIIYNGRWRGKTSDGLIVCPGTKTTISDLLQWCLDNRLDNQRRLEDGKQEEIEATDCKVGRGSETSRSLSER